MSDFAVQNHHSKETCFLSEAACRPQKPADSTFLVPAKQACLKSQSSASYVLPLPLPLPSLSGRSAAPPSLQTNSVMMNVCGKTGRQPTHARAARRLEVDDKCVLLQVRIPKPLFNALQCSKINTSKTHVTVRLPSTSTSSAHRPSSSYTPCTRPRP